MILLIFLCAYIGISSLHHSWNQVVALGSRLLVLHCGLALKIAIATILIRTTAVILRGSTSVSYTSIKQWMVYFMVTCGLLSTFTSELEAIANFDPMTQKLWQNFQLHYMQEFNRLNSLEFIEPYWQSMVESYSSFTIVSLFTFFGHECAYFLSWVPFLIMDQIPYCNNFKIQSTKPNTTANIKKCLKGILFNHTCVQFPMILIADWGLRQLGFTFDLPLPSLTSITLSCFLNFVVEDFYFYIVHRLLHWKRIYKYVHKVHHEFAAPFGITAEYAHPVETIVLGIGTILGPLLHTRHLLTLWFWLVVRVMETVEDHSGYEVPFNPTNFIPFWGGAVHHDHHHRTFEGNYASVFTFWDFVFGTDKKFRAHQEKQREAGKSTWTDTFDFVGLSSSESITIRAKFA